MTEEGIGSVVTSLKDLNTATINSAVEFQGFTKSLTRAADATSKAGKNWTIFSRLVSGTPLWAFQNKLRAYLSILGTFEEKSKANSKAMKEEEKKIVDRFHAVEKVKKEQKFMNKQMEGTIKVMKTQNKTFEEAQQINMAYAKKGLQQQIESTEKIKELAEDEFDRRKEESKQLQRMNDAELQNELQKRMGTTKYLAASTADRQSYIDTIKNNAAKRVKVAQETLKTLQKQHDEESEILQKKKDELKEFGESTSEAVKNTKE